MNGQRLRPLGVGDVFDEGFDLYKRNFVFLLLAGALTIAPLDLGLTYAAPAVLPPIYAQFGVSGAAGDAGSLWIVRGLASLILFLPLYALAAAPLVAAASALYLDRAVTLRQVYALCLRRLPGLAAAALLAGLSLALGMGLCLIGWAVPATMLLFTFHALLAEGRGPGKALGRSWSLAGGHGSRVFGCLLLLGGVLWTVGLGLSLPLKYLFETGLGLSPGAAGLYGGPGAGPQARALVVDTLSAGLGHLLLIPFFVCVATAQYYDLRVRKEGYDVELMAQELNYPPLSALGPFLPPVAAFVPPRPGPRPPAPPAMSPPPAMPPPPTFGGPPR